MPKQLLNIVGEATMLEQTVARISPLIPAERTLVVAGDAYRDPIRAYLPQLPEENFFVRAGWAEYGRLCGLGRAVGMQTCF